MNFPNKWNVDLEPDHTLRVKVSSTLSIQTLFPLTLYPQRTVAEALLPILKLELQHLSLPEIIRRPRESEVRATCGESER